MLFLNGEIWSTKSDFGKSYPVSLGTLCRIIFMKHILQIFQNCQKHWISIFHSNMMFTKCSSNSTYFEHRTDNERFHILAVELKHQFLALNIRTSNFEHGLTNHYTNIMNAKCFKPPLYEYFQCAVLPIRNLRCHNPVLPFFLRLSQEAFQLASNVLQGKGTVCLLSAVVDPLDGWTLKFQNVAQIKIFRKTRRTIWVSIIISVTILNSRFHL